MRTEQEIRKAREIAFFEALHQLFTQYEATLNGCGCCNSPEITLDGRAYKEYRIRVSLTALNKPCPSDISN